MRCTAYDGKGGIREEWFIHFTFSSTYVGEEDCSKHDEDYWKAFWKLKNVKYDKICKGHFASPDAWNYIREADEVNMDGLHLGKWMNHSPFHKNGIWQSKKYGNNSYWQPAFL